MSTQRHHSPAFERPANRVQDLRRERGWSMEELARRANTTRQRIWAIEHGETRLNEDWLRKLASALDVAPIDLLPPQDQGLALTPDEIALLKAIRTLPPERRALLPGLIAGLGQPAAA